MDTQKAEGMNILFACSERASAPDGESSVSWNTVGGLHGEEDRIASSLLRFLTRTDEPTLYLMYGGILTVPNADFLA